MAAANRSIATIVAAAIALIVWAGLIIEFAASMDRVGGPVRALWVMARYFTVLANIAVALTFSGE